MTGLARSFRTFILVGRRYHSLIVLFLFLQRGIVLAQAPPIIYTITPNDTICAGDTIHFLQHFDASSTYTFGIGGNEPGWIGISGTDSTNGTHTGGINFYMNFEKPGVYTFTLSASNGVNTLDSVVTIWELPDTSAVTILPSSSGSVCAGTPVSFTATPANGGAAPTYQWMLNGNPVGSNSAILNAGILNDNDIVTVSMLSNAPCVHQAASASFTVYIMAPVTPSVSINPLNAGTCATGYITFTATPLDGGTNPIFHWYLNGSSIGAAGPIYTLQNPVAGDQVSVVLKSNASCIAIDSALSDTARVNITAFIANASPLQTICSGRKSVLSVNGGAAWTWTPSASLDCDSCENPMATPSVTTVYTVVATQWGCSDTTTDTVVVIPTAIASFAQSVVSAGIPELVMFQNNSQNAVTYQWNFGDNTSSILASPLHGYNYAGNYPIVLIAYGGMGCNDTARMDLLVTDTIGIKIPNVFTPNGDNINDVFAIDIHGFASYDFVIYDRWGVKVFESNNKNWWDGATTAGLLCVEGTYFYIFSGYAQDKSARQQKGYLQLIR